MGLVVEDGTGKADAESYVSVLEASTYHERRGNGDAWDAIEDQEAALRKATDYLTMLYSGSWRGIRATATQALDWPRSDVDWPENSIVGMRPLNVIPPELKNAVAELALRTTADLLIDESPPVKQETIGPLTTVYETGGRAQTRYATVDAWLTTLLDYSRGGGGGVIPLVRA